MSPMFNPPHPGATLGEDILPALGLTVTDAARQLGITRTALSRILNGHAGIFPEMARRIESWLGSERGGRAEIWLGMQMDYDLWIAEQRPAPLVERSCWRHDPGSAVSFSCHRRLLREISIKTIHH